MLAHAAQLAQQPPPVVAGSSASGAGGQSASGLGDDEDGFEHAYDYSDSESSDGDLDWDPDRERLMRSLRAQGAGTPGGGSSQRAASGVGTLLTPSKSLNERRQEWRAARGLAPQLTVQELLAEKRAQRQLSYRAAAPGSCAPAAPPAVATNPFHSGRSIGGLENLALEPRPANSPAATATEESIPSSSRSDKGLRKSLFSSLWGKK